MKDTIQTLATKNLLEMPKEIISNEIQKLKSIIETKGFELLQQPIAEAIRRESTIIANATAVSQSLFQSLIASARFDPQTDKNLSKAANEAQRLILNQITGFVNQ